MAGIKFFSQVLNQKGAPAIYEDLRANLPTPNFQGRLFFATDLTPGNTIFRDTGTAWVALANNLGTGFTGATNGLSAFGSSVGLGGTLVQNTQISGNNAYLIKFDDYTQFAIGNNIQPSLLLDTPNSKISTSYNGNIIGLSLDFANNIFRLGYDGVSAFNIEKNMINNDVYMYTQNLSGDAEGFIFNSGTQNNVQLGFTSSGQANLITIDNDNQIIKTSNSGNDNGLYLDFAINNYLFGDYNTIVNGTKLQIDDNNQKINLQSILGLYNLTNLQIHANNAAALAAGLVVGDLYYQGAGNLHVVF